MNSWALPSLFYLETHHGEVQPHRPSPPPEAAGFLLAANKGVVVELCANILRPLVGERILFQQRCHGGFVFEQPFEESRKPPYIPRVIERGEPHLPVQSWLVWDVPARASRQIARFITEFVLAPFDAVLRALDDDFLALCRHDREQ